MTEKEIEQRKPINVCLGCGMRPIKDFINVDMNPKVKPDVVRDIERGLPFDDNSIDNIYSAHFMEHVAPDNINFVMSEIWRVLKNTGKFQCIVPINGSLFGSPYHKSFWNEHTTHFFTVWNNPEETGFEFKMVHQEKLAQTEVVNEQLMFVLEAVKPEPKPLYNKRFLNLGSGNRPRPVAEGWINLDIDETCNPDIVRSLDKGLPFADNSVDGVYTSHVIEHVEDVFFFMSEIWRVCKPDTHIEIIAPNHAHLFSIYPNHKRFIRPQYFEMWTPLETWRDYLPVMNNQVETMGAEFISLHESIIENSGAIKFNLQVVKKGGKIKEDLIRDFDEYKKENNAK